MMKELGKELKELVKENHRLIYYSKSSGVFEVKEKLLRKCIETIEKRSLCRVNISLEVIPVQDRIIVKASLEAFGKKVESLGEAKYEETGKSIEARIAERRAIKRALEGLVSYNFIDEAIEELIEEGKLSAEREEKKKDRKKKAEGKIKKKKEEIKEEVVGIIEEGEDEIEKLEKALEELLK